MNQFSSVIAKIHVPSAFQLNQSIYPNV